MDALMSRILTSARMKTEPQEQPLDLAWTSYTRHTCDRLVALEDLRTDQETSYSTEEDDSPAGRNAHWAIQSTPESGDSSPGSVDEKPASTKPHPFSITALIGDATRSDDRGSSSAPAQVFSPHMDTGVMYQSYIAELYKQTSPVRADHGSDLSPIRAVSMLKRKDIFWCHVCSILCDNQNEADMHQHAHRIRGDRCNTRRAILREYGYVTCHEVMDNDRLQCGLCHKVVATCFFHKHQRLHDGHFCQICAREFSTNSRLQDHMNAHTGRTPFSCTVCDRKFAKRSSLTQHQRYHRDHKSFSCAFCHKSFNSKYACAVHERLHTGDNPFKCQFPGCTRAFPQKIQLKLHINSHHLS